jgi:uncharacterized iron-regulated membrane protein
MPVHGTTWRLRKALYLLHMFLGVTAAIYFSVMSCSGVSLVFKEELATWLNNAPKIQVLPSLAPLSEVVRNVETRYPGQQVSGLIYPLEPERCLLVYVLNKDGVYLPVLMNQYDASIVGPAPENQVLKFLQELHHNLLFSKTGRKINGCGGLVLFILAFSGIGLFLRGVKYCVHVLRMQWNGHRSVIVWSMHQQVGVFLLPMLLIWGSSGFSFGFRHEFERAVNVVFPVSALIKEDSKKNSNFSTGAPMVVSADKPTSNSNSAQNPISASTSNSASISSVNSDRTSNSNSVPKSVPTSTSTIAEGATPSRRFRRPFRIPVPCPPDSTNSLNLLIPLATKVCPGQKVVRISTAIDGEDIAKVWLTDCNSFIKADNTEVDISTSRCIVTSISRPGQRTSGDLVLIWLQRLHFGNFGGTVSRLIWMVMGFAPLILSVTGLMMWWHRKFR